MSEQNKGKIEVIPFDASVNVEIGGGMYARLHQLMWSKASKKTADDFAKLLEHLKQGGKPRDEYEYEIETYLSLLYGIELAAKEQGKLSYVEPSAFTPPKV